MKIISTRKIISLLAVFFSFVMCLSPSAAQTEMKGESSGSSGISAPGDRPLREPYRQITKIDLGVDRLEMKAGDSYTFHISYEPDDPFFYTPRWYVTDDSVIRVNQSDNSVMALAPGSARILAESRDGMAFAVCEVTVRGPVNGRENALSRPGSEIVQLSDADLSKITARSVTRFLKFVSGSAFSTAGFRKAQDHIFIVTADVVPGTEKAESKRALDLGMSKAQPLTKLHMVNLTGTLEQILSFTADNPELIEIFELANSYPDPVIPAPNEGIVGKAMNLGGNTEALTSVSTAHNLGLKGDGFAVAVIDTGLNVGHEQFEGRIAAQHCFSTEMRYDANERIESSCQDSREEADSAVPGDVLIPENFNHGSHVTGIAAGRDGIAPNARIVSVLAFSEYVWVCTQDDIRKGYYFRDENGIAMCYSAGLGYQNELAAYDWLITTQEEFIESSRPPIAAVNMSYGGDETFSSACDINNSRVKEAFQALIDVGIVPVSASGNEYSDSGISSPSCLSNAFSVGALADSPSPLIVGFSNHSELVDILAPGHNILSAFYTYEDGESDNFCQTGGNCYGRYSGTSMAAPMVTGAFAILKQLYPDMSVKELEKTLIEMSSKTADTRVSGMRFRYSKPVLDFSGLYVPLPAEEVRILDPLGTDITGQEITIDGVNYQLKAAALPAEASQRFIWKSSDTSTAMVDANGNVSFTKSGTVAITAFAADGSGKSAWVKLTCDWKAPLASAVKIVNYNDRTEDLTGMTIVTDLSVYPDLWAEAVPAEASQEFTWKSSDPSVASLDEDLNLIFSKGGTVTITAETTDGSNKSAWVKLVYAPEAPVLEIKDSNIRGKNREIQITIPWRSELIKTECTLYNDETGEEVVMSVKERMDSTGKNRIISYVGNPLVNGTVYRFKVRVYNGQWSNYVEKYAMPIANVYGATVVAGNKTMVINNQWRENTTGTRYMLCDADTEKEITYKVGTKSNTTWTYSQLTNSKLYFVIAVPYRDYKGQRLWGPNQMRIYFMPMGIPGNGKVTFTNNTTAEVSIGNDSTVDGIRVLYRTVSGALKNGCEGAGNKCKVSGLNKNTAYEFYVMKYKTAQGKKYYSMGTLIPYKTALSGLKAPQNNPVVTMTNSGYTTFSIKKAAEADGISVLYREGEGAFQQACEKAGNSCSTTLSTAKNYTFYIMQYKVVSGKKLYSNGIVARDFSSGKSADVERLYTKFYPADEILSEDEIAALPDGYQSEDSLLMAETLEVLAADMEAVTETEPKSADEIILDPDDHFLTESLERETNGASTEAPDMQSDMSSRTTSEPESAPFTPFDLFFIGSDQDPRDVPPRSFENR